MLQRNNTQVFIKPLFREGRLKLIKLYTPSYPSAHEEFENLCFVSAASMVCMSHVLVFNIVDIKNHHHFFAFVHIYAQVTSGIKLQRLLC